jgi:hypothetical protein
VISSSDTFDSDTRSISVFSFLKSMISPTKFGQVDLKALNFNEMSADQPAGVPQCTRMDRLPNLARWRVFNPGQGMAHGAIFAKTTNLPLFRAEFGWIDERSDQLGPLHQIGLGHFAELAVQQ